MRIPGHLIFSILKRRPGNGAPFFGRMRVSGHANLAECQNGSKSGANRRPNRRTNRRTKFPKKQPLWCHRWSPSETSVPHLLSFLKYSDKISMGPNGPVWDVYYYTSPPANRRTNRRTKRGRAKHSARFARARRAPPPSLEESTGGKGGRVVVNGAALAVCQIFDFPDSQNPKIPKKVFAQNLLKNRFG